MLAFEFGCPSLGLGEGKNGIYYWIHKVRSHSSDPFVNRTSGNRRAVDMQQSSQFLVEEAKGDESQSGHNPRLPAGTPIVISKKPMESNPNVGLICKADDLAAQMGGRVGNLVGERYDMQCIGAIVVFDSRR